LIKNCKFCGNEFEAKTEKAQYCSSGCKRKYRNENIKVNKICEYCGEEYIGNPKSKFCSTSCGSKYLHKHKEPTKRECIICGKEIIYKGTTKKLYCDECRKSQNVINSTLSRIIKGKMKIENVGIGSGNRELKGKENRHYKNGVGLYKKMRLQYLEENNLPIQCEECGNTKNLDTHHIDMDKTNNEIENLILLCRSCHKNKHIGGEKNHRAKLKNHQVVEIFINSLNLTRKELTEKYEVTDRIIQRIQDRETWKSVTKDLI
jgi:hypothetical protein